MPQTFNRSVLIENGTIGHIPEWARLRAALWPNRSHQFHVEELSSMFNREPQNTFGIVAELPNRTLVGFAEASIRHDYVNGCSSTPVLFLEGIFVEPSHRRHRVAGALVEAVRSIGKGLGCSEIASDASLDNVDSHLFHKALGFEETERVVFFRRSL